MNEWIIVAKSQKKREADYTDDEGTLSHCGSPFPGRKHVWPSQINTLHGGSEVYTKTTKRHIINSLLILLAIMCSDCRKSTRFFIETRCKASKCIQSKKIAE